MDDRKKWSKKGKIQYIGIILDENSQDSLQQWAKNTFGGVLSKVFSHHVTLMFKPTIEDIESLADSGIIGQPISLPVVGYAGSEEVQAVVVDVSKSPLRPVNDIPHITVATSGVAPKESNILLEKGYQTENFPPLVLNGKLGFVGRGKELFEVVWER